MPPKGELPPLPMSDAHFEPRFRNGPIAHPPAPEGPGSSAMDAARAFRQRVRATVEQATPRFRTPGQGKKKGK